MEDILITNPPGPEADLPGTNPTDDPIGLVRIEPHDGGHSVWLHTGGTPGNEWLCVWSTAGGNIGCTLPPEDVKGMRAASGIPGTPAAPVVDGDPKDAEIRALANQLHRIIDEEDCPEKHVTAAHVAELIVNIDNMLEDLAGRPTVDAYKKACDALELRRVALVKALGLPAATSFYDAVDQVAQLTHERDTLSEMLRGMARRAVACRQGYEAVASAYTAITAEDDRTSPPMDPSACGCGHPWHQIEADLLTARRDVALASRPAIPADAEEGLRTGIGAWLDTENLRELSKEDIVRGAAGAAMGVLEGWAPSVGSASGHTVICASLRQREDILAAAEDAWKQGRWVFAPAANPAVTPAEHARIHRVMIDQATEVLVTRKLDGSLGEAVTGERKYAVEHGKPVRYWAPSVGSDTTAAKCDGGHPCAAHGKNCPDPYGVFERPVDAVDDPDVQPVSSGGDTDTPAGEVTRG